MGGADGIMKRGGGSRSDGARAVRRRVVRGLTTGRDGPPDGKAMGRLLVVDGA